MEAFAATATALRHTGLAKTTRNRHIMGNVAL
jgi:hypothetical protein